LFFRGWDSSFLPLFPPRSPCDLGGSPLPRALFVNDVGYLPDGTPMNKAGNCINHPDTWPVKHGKAGPAAQHGLSVDIHGISWHFHGINMA